MALILYSIFLFALQIAFYHTEAMPTTGHFVKMPVNCRNETFCTDDTNYPQEIVDRLLKKHNILSYTIEVNPDILAPRLGKEIIEPCKLETQWKKDINYIIDEHNNVRVVVQSMDRFRQLIPITKCQSKIPSEHDVNIVRIDMGENYVKNLKCVESKFNFNFVVLSLDWKTLELARVMDGGVPIGCQCIYVE